MESSASLVHLADVIQALPLIESCRTGDLVPMLFGDAGAHLLRLTDAVPRLVHRGGLVSRLGKGFVSLRREGSVSTGVSGSNNKIDSICDLALGRPFRCRLRWEGSALIVLSRSWELRSKAAETLLTCFCYRTPARWGHRRQHGARMLSWCMACG